MGKHTSADPLFFTDGLTPPPKLAKDSVMSPLTLVPGSDGRYRVWDAKQGKYVRVFEPDEKAAAEAYVADRPKGRKAVPVPVPEGEYEAPVDFRPLTLTAQEPARRSETQRELLTREDPETPHMRFFASEKGWRVWNPITRMYVGDMQRNAFRSEATAMVRLREMFLQVEEAKRAARPVSEAKKRARAREALSGDIFAKAPAATVLVTGEQAGFKFNPGRVYLPDLAHWTEHSHGDQERDWVWESPTLRWRFTIQETPTQSRSYAQHRETPPLGEPYREDYGMAHYGRSHDLDDLMRSLRAWYARQPRSAEDRNPFALNEGPEVSDAGLQATNALWSAIQVHDDRSVHDAIAQYASLGTREPASQHAIQAVFQRRNGRSLRPRSGEMIPIAQAPVETHGVQQAWKFNDAAALERSRALADNDVKRNPSIADLSREGVPTVSFYAHDPSPDEDAWRIRVKDSRSVKPSKMDRLYGLPMEVIHRHGIWQVSYWHAGRRFVNTQNRASFFDALRETVEKSGAVVAGDFPTLPDMTKRNGSETEAMPPLDDWQAVNERMHVWTSARLGWEFEIFSRGGSTREDALDPAEGVVRTQGGVLASFEGPNQRDVYEQMRDFFLAEGPATTKANDHAQSRRYRVGSSGDARRPWAVFDPEGYPIDTAASRDAAQALADAENELVARKRADRHEGLYAYRPNDVDAMERHNGRRQGEVTPTMLEALHRIVAAGERGGVMHWRFTGSSRESHGVRKATLEALEGEGLIQTRTDRRPPQYGSMGGRYEEIDTYATATTAGVMFAAQTPLDKHNGRRMVDTQTGDLLAWRPAPVATLPAERPRPALPAPTTPTAPTAPTGTLWVVKLWAPGEKRAELLSPQGTTRLRIHAALFRDQARATRAAEILMEDNPGWRAEAHPAQA